MQDLKFILCDLSSDLCDEWKKSLEYYKIDNKNFIIFNGRLEDCKYEFECIVSPANSYGRMDGGLDMIISHYFSPHKYQNTIRHVQSVLYEQCNGYQIPGTCMLIGMDIFNKPCKWLAHVPTMKVPENVCWNKDIIYNCMYSLLNSINIHNKQHLKNKSKIIKNVFITGLATGIGGVSSKICAKQMILAYKNFIETLQSKTFTMEWCDIHNKLQDLY